MTTSLYTSLHTYTNDIATHQSSMLASLERRLGVAKAACNWQLIELLEVERQEISPGSFGAKTLRRNASCKESPSSRLQSELQDIWHKFIEMCVPKAELQIEQTADSNGNTWWYACNPQTGQSVYSGSEAEMRLWIETNCRNM
jgi:hypothetical protein